MSSDRSLGRPAALFAARGARVLLGLAITALALLLSWAALLNIIIRDVPQPSRMAEGPVADLAIGAGVDEADAARVAEEAVAALDDTALNGSLDTADNIRLGIPALPWIFLAAIGLILVLTPSGWPRRRRLGWSVMVAGSGLVLLVAELGVNAGRQVVGDGSSVGGTARRLIDHLLGPAWPIGLAAVVIGGALWAWGMVVWMREQRAGETAAA